MDRKFLSSIPSIEEEDEDVVSDTEDMIEYSYDEESSEEASSAEVATNSNEDHKRRQSILIDEIKSIVLDEKTVNIDTDTCDGESDGMEGDNIKNGNENSCSVSLEEEELSLISDDKDGNVEKEIRDEMLGAALDHENKNSSSRSYLENNLEEGVEGDTNSILSVSKGANKGKKMVSFSIDENLAVSSQPEIALSSYESDGDGEESLTPFVDDVKDTNQTENSNIERNDLDFEENRVDAKQLESDVEADFQKPDCCEEIEVEQSDIIVNDRKSEASLEIDESKKSSLDEGFSNLEMDNSDGIDRTVENQTNGSELSQKEKSNDKAILLSEDDLKEKSKECEVEILMDSSDGIDRSLENQTNGNLENLMEHGNGSELSQKENSNDKAILLSEDDSKEKSKECEIVVSIDRSNSEMDNSDGIYRSIENHIDDNLKYNVEHVNSSDLSQKEFSNDRAILLSREDSKEKFKECEVVVSMVDESQGMDDSFRQEKHEDELLTLIGSISPKHKNYTEITPKPAEFHHQVTDEEIKYESEIRCSNTIDSTNIGDINPEKIISLTTRSEKNIVAKERKRQHGVIPRSTNLETLKKQEIPDRNIDHKDNMKKLKNKSRRKDVNSKLKTKPNLENVTSDVKCAEEVRDLVFATWYKERLKMSEQKLKIELQQKKEEQKMKMELKKENKISDEVSFKKWNEKKNVLHKEVLGKKKAKIESLKIQLKEKAEQKDEAQKVYKSWKKEKEEYLNKSRRKIKPKKCQNEKVERKKEAEQTFLAWQKNVEKKLREEKIATMKREVYKKLHNNSKKDERDKDALEAYRLWIQKKHPPKYN